MQEKKEEEVDRRRDRQKDNSRAKNTEIFSRF